MIHCLCVVHAGDTLSVCDDTLSVCGPCRCICFVCSHTLCSRIASAVMICWREWRYLCCHQHAYLHRRGVSPHWLTTSFGSDKLLTLTHHYLQTPVTWWVTLVARIKLIYTYFVIVSLTQRQLVTLIEYGWMLSLTSLMLHKFVVAFRPPAVHLHGVNGDL